MDIIGYILFCLLFVFGGGYLFTYLRNSSIDKDISAILPDAPLFKILDKKCSAKRLGKSRTIILRQDIYQKCSIYINDDFVIVRGFESLLHTKIVTTFALKKDSSVNITNWPGNVFKLTGIQVTLNKTQIKIVYQTDYNTEYFNEQVHSLIVNNLAPEEFEKLKVMEQWDIIPYAAKA